MKEINKRAVIIDISGIASKKTLHRVLRAHLDLPEYYGNNLDALHDCLTDGVQGIRLAFINTEAPKPGMESYMTSLRNMLKEVSEERQDIEVLWK